MLIQTDKALLGDANLNLAEGIEKAREDTARQAAAFKIPDQKLLEDHEMALGRVLDWTELISRVSKLTPAKQILFERGGVRNAIAVRIVERGEKRYITGFYQMPLPEFSAVIVDDHGLPQREVRGWRTVLLSLVRAGALTENQVELTFGPATGKRSVLWDRSMQSIR